MNTCAHNQAMDNANMYIELNVIGNIFLRMFYYIIQLVDDNVKTI